MHFILAQANNGSSSAGGLIGSCIGGLIGLALVILSIAGMWKAFVKAGEPGWAAIIPIYNAIVLLKIAGKPIWWILILLFVPCLDLIFGIILVVAVAKAFGKGAGYAVGLILLPFIFWPLLGFGDAKYVGAGASS